MQTDYKYLNFFHYSTDPDTKKVNYVCVNKSGEHLGFIAWYAPWRQYCYFDTSNAVYAKSCLKDIATFIIQLSKAQEA